MTSHQQVEKREVKEAQDILHANPSILKFFIPDRKHNTCLGAVRVSGGFDEGVRLVFHGARHFVVRSKRGTTLHDGRLDEPATQPPRLIALNIHLQTTIITSVKHS